MVELEGSEEETGVEEEVTGAEEAGCNQSAALRHLGPPCL